MDYTQVRIASLRLHCGTQLRPGGLDDAQVKHLAAIVREDLERGAPRLARWSLPAIDVFQVARLLIPGGGFHRIAGYALAGETHIPANLHLGTLQQARVFAAGQNWQRELHRSPADLHAALDVMFADALIRTNRAIAEHCHTTHRTVALALASYLERYPDDHRREAGRRTVERGGSVYEMDVSGFVTPPPVLVPGWAAMNAAGQLDEADLAQLAAMSPAEQQEALDGPPDRVPDHPKRLAVLLGQVESRLRLLAALRHGSPDAALAALAGLRRLVGELAG